MNLFYGERNEKVFYCNIFNCVLLYHCHINDKQCCGSRCFSVVKNKNNTLGENIAAGRGTPEGVVDQWMYSEGHRANILNPVFKELGVGYCCDENTEYEYYWVQIFRG